MIINHYAQKLLCCLMFFFCFHSNNGYMNPNTNEDEIIRQAEAISKGENSDTFYLKEIKFDADFENYVEPLKEIVNSYIDRKVTLKDLHQLSREVTRAYRNEGYLGAIAYVPGQETRDGKITIKVTSGNLVEITLDNQSKLDTDTLETMKNNIKLNKAVNSKYIENILYRMNSLGGIKATGQLEKIPNSTDICFNITVVDDKKTKNIAYVENHGSESSGKNRLGYVHNSYNIDGKGSNIEVGGLVSNGNLRNYHIDYNVISNKKTGSRAGISISRTTYDLGKEYDQLDATGTYNDFTIYGKSTAFQSHSNELNFNYGYRYRKISDNIGAFNLSTDKQSHALFGEVSGYHRKTKGILNYSLKLTVGHHINQSKYANLLNNYNNTEGIYTKLNGKVDYLQSMNKNWNFRTTFSWQQADKHLDSSEKMNIGGVYGVRGYSSGSASGDQGLLSRTELIYQTKVKGLSAKFFYDIGSIGNKGNHLNTLQSYGIGLDYQKTNDFFAQLIYARKIGFNENVSSDKDKSKLWVMVGKIF